MLKQGMTERDMRTKWGLTTNMKEILKGRVYQTCVTGMIGDW